MFRIQFPTSVTSLARYIFLDLLIDIYDGCPSTGNHFYLNILKSGWFSLGLEILGDHLRQFEET